MNNIEKRSKMLFLIGQLSGIAYRLDVDTVEDFLSDPPKDFRYCKECRAALEFRNSIYSPNSRLTVIADGFAEKGESGHKFEPYDNTGRSGCGICGKSESTHR